MKKFVGLVTILKYITSDVIANENYLSKEIVCPTEYKYKPVCGSDGFTYINEDVLKCTSEYNENQGLAPVYASEEYCKECKCQNVNLPVCALDGTTYSNECELDCVNRYRISRGLSIVFLAYRAKCNGPPCECPTIASPVCGTDEILYRNECVLNCASNNTIASGLPEIGLKNLGACRDGCLCPETYQPVCGSDGKSYYNPCKLQCANCKQKDSKYHNIISLHPGRCSTCICYEIYDPVCASDGTSFGNQCLFNCENEKRDYAGLESLSILGKGMCVSCICQARNDPVCGLNNQTYANDCLLKCENEARAEKGLHGLSVLYKGECQAATVDCYCNHCPVAYDPVCGDDYATYWNYCMMTCISDCNYSNGYKSLQLLKNETCF